MQKDLAKQRSINNYAIGFSKRKNGGKTTLNILGSPWVIACEISAFIGLIGQATWAGRQEG